METLKMSHIATNYPDNLWPEAFHPTHNVKYCRAPEHIEVEQKTFKADRGLKVFRGIVFGVIFSAPIWALILYLALKMI